MDKIELKKATCEISNDFIITLTVKDNVEIDVNDVQSIRDSNLKLANGNSYVLLVDVGKYSTINTEARALTAKKEFGETRLAMAFIIKNLAQKIVGNFFINVNNPPTPTKIFNNKKEATEWLKKFLK